MPTAFPYGEIYGINAQGVMVGIMWNDAQEERAFVFDAAGGVQDLNALVDPALGWTLQFARDVNDAGQIVGSGTVDGVAREFLLSPALAVSIGDVRVMEGNRGTRVARFRVRLSAASAAAVSVGFATADGTAAGGQRLRGEGGHAHLPARGPRCGYVDVTVNG